MKKKQKKEKTLILSDIYQGVAISLLVDVLCLFIVGLFAVRGYFPKIFIFFAFFYLAVLHFITALIVRWRFHHRPDLVRGTWIVFWLFPLFFLVLFVIALTGAMTSSVLA
jgi:hypothetical protein